MAAALQLLKSISYRRQERHDLEMQMLVIQKSESRKPKLQMMEDDEIDTAKAIGLCAVRAKRPRKEKKPRRTEEFHVVETWLPKLGRHCVQKTFDDKSSNVSVHS